MSLTETGTLVGPLPVSPARQSVTARRVELEQRFCVLLNEKLRAETLRQQAHDEMMRIQGALAELDRLDQPAAGNGAGPG